MTWWIRLRRKSLFIVREAEGGAEIMRFWTDNGYKVIKILKRRYRSGKLLTPSVSIHRKEKTVAILNLNLM